MKLNKDQIKEAKNLNKHQMDDLMEEAIALEDALDAILKAPEVVEMQKRIDLIKEMMNVRTGKETMNGLKFRAVYDDPYNRYSVNGRAIFEEDEDYFYSHGGKVATVRAFNKFERI